MLSPALCLSSCALPVAVLSLDRGRASRPAASGKGDAAAAARRREGKGSGGVVGGHHSAAFGGDSKESEPTLSLWARYLEANKKRPLLTKMITTGVLSAVGNVGGQLIIMGKGKQKKIDFKKVSSFKSCSPPKTAASSLQSSQRRETPWRLDLS